MGEGAVLFFCQCDILINRAAEKLAPAAMFTGELLQAQGAPVCPLTSVCQCQCVQVVACLYHCVCLHVPVEVGCEGLRWFQSVCVRAYMYVSVGAYVCG